MRNRKLTGWLLRVMPFDNLVECAVYVGVYGEVARVHREAVAELVGGLVKELPDVLHKVIVTAGKAAPVLAGRTDFLPERIASLSVRAM
jgi:hypothetical protein